MPGNDLNVNIPVGITNLSKIPLAEISKDFDKTKNVMERPVRTRFEADTSGLDRATRDMQRFRADALKPMVLKPTVDAVGLQLSSRRGREPQLTPAQTGVIPRINTPSIEFKDNLIPLKPMLQQRDDYEKAVRDAMAGIVKGMQHRAEAEQAIAKQADIEREARTRLFGNSRLVSSAPLGDVNGPAVRGRFASLEQAARDERANILRQTKDRTDAESVGLRSLNRSRTGRDVSMQAGAEADVFASRTRGNGYNNLSLPSDNDQGEDSLRDRRRKRAGTDKAGGKGGDPLAKLANVLPGLGTAGVIMLGIKAVGDLPQTLKAFRTNRENYGTIQGAAQMAGDALGIGGMARNFHETLESGFGFSYTYKLQQQRRDKEDMDRQVREMRAAKRERDSQTLNPLLASLSETTLTSRQGLARTRLRDDFDVARLSLDQEYQNKGGELDRKLQQGRDAKYDPEDMKALEAQVAEARKAAGLKYEADIAKLREDRIERDANVVRDSQLAHNDAVFDLQQKTYEAQGNEIAASIARINRDADRAISDADNNIAAVNKQYGMGSVQSKAAYQAKADAEMAAKGARTVGIGEVIRQANISANDAIVAGLRNRAALGDIGAANDASDRSLDAIAKERERQLRGLIDSNALDAQRVAELKKQLADLKPLAERQKRLAREGNEAAERVRLVGSFGDINSNRIAELRRTADRTGNRGLGLRADLADVEQQAERRRADLQKRLTDPALTKAEQDELNQALKDLPRELEGQLKDVIRPKITGADYANNALATAQDAGGLTGLALDAKESAQIESLKVTQDMAKDIKDLLKFFTNGGGNNKPAPLPPNFYRPF